MLAYGGQVYPTGGNSLSTGQALVSGTRRPRRRGNLRLFMGGVTGRVAVVQMLEAARASLRLSGQIVIGYLNPMRSQTCVTVEERIKQQQIERLRTQFEVLPRLTRPVLGRVPGWFDVQAAIERAPRVVLIDAPMPVAVEPQLAVKPYDPWRGDEEIDMEDLLLHGIDVWIAMRVAPVWGE